MSCNNCQTVHTVIIKETEVEKVHTLFKNPQEGIRFDASSVLVSAPPPPKNLVVEQVLSESSIALDWEDLSASYTTQNTNFDSYTVYVRNTSTNTIVQTITGITLSEVDVMGLTKDTQYEFWVTAVRGEGESNDSNHVFDTPKVVPTAPTGIVLDNATQTTLDISWNANPEPEVDGYNLYVDGVKNNTQIITSTSYQITGLEQATEYTVAVEAVNDDVVGPQSSLVVSTTVETFPLVYAGSGYGTILVIDYETGDLVQEYTTNLTFYSSHILIDPFRKHAYWIGDNGRIRMLNVNNDGTLSYNKYFRPHGSGEIAPALDAEDTGDLFLGQNTVKRVDVETGNTLWTSNDFGFKPFVVISNGELWAIDYYGECYKLDKSDGSVLDTWSSPVPNCEWAEVDRDGYVHVAAWESGTRMIDLQNKTQINSIGVGYWISEQTFVAAGDSDYIIDQIADSYGYGRAIRKSDYGTVLSGQDWRGGSSFRKLGDVVENHFVVAHNGSGNWEKYDYDGNMIWRNTDGSTNGGVKIYPGQS